MENKVLFQIVTLDVPMTVNGIKKVLSGGQIYNVVDFVEGKFYVTDVENSPGRAQLIPWDFATKILKVPNE